MKKLAIIILSVFISAGAFSQTNSGTNKHLERINKALGIGNVDAIATYFSSSVDVSVLDKEGVFSSAQTKNILKNFFVSHKPEKFVILHSSGKEDSKYYIGSLTTQSGEYRIFYVTKYHNSDIPQITQFRIERKNH